MSNHILEELKNADVSAFEKRVIRLIPEMGSLLQELQKGKRYPLTMDLYTFWHNGVMECMDVWMENPVGNEDLLRRGFDLIETLCIESELTNALMFSSTIEKLKKHPNFSSRIAAFMGPETKKLWGEHDEMLHQFQLWKLAQLQ